MNNLRVDKLTRNFLSPSSSVTPGNKNAIGEFQIEDPTYLTFNIQFLFIPTESIAGLAAGLLLPRNNPLSACNYLDRIDEPARADLLELFIADLKKISEEFPWYFQSVSGLQKFTQINLQDSIAIKTEDDFIEITCLESIDLRISKMFDMYRKATYDGTFRRDMLPDNLRQFNYQIHVTEFRKFHTFTMGTVGSSASSPLSQIADGLTDISNLAGTVSQIAYGLKEGNVTTTVQGASLLSQQLSTIAPLQTAVAKIVELDNFVSVLTFNLDRCQFIMDDFYPYLSELSVVDSEMATQKFKISVMKVSETNSYPISKMVLRDQVSKSQYPSGTFTVPAVGLLGSTTPTTFKSQVGDNVDDIVNAIFPSTNSANNITGINLVNQNKLKGDSIFDQVASTFNKYQSALESKFQQAGLGSVNNLIGDAENAISNAFNRIVLGNVYEIDPSLQNPPISNAINEVSLESNTDNFKPSENIGLTGSESYTISDISLDGNESNLTIGDVNLISNTEKFADTPITITGFSEDFTPSGINLTSVVDADSITDIDLTNSYTPSAIGEISLNSSVDKFSVTDIELTNSYTPTAIGEISLDSTTDGFTTSEIGLTGSYTPSAIGTIDLDSNVSTSRVGQISLDSNDIASVVTPITTTPPTLKQQLMAQNIYSRYKSQPTGVTPINLEDNSTKFGVSNVSETSAGNDSTITPIELTGNSGVNKIAPVELTSNPDAFKVSDIELESSVTQLSIAPVSADSQLYSAPPIQNSDLTSNDPNFKVAPKNILKKNKNNQ